MSSGKTETLGLNQWQLTDPFQMEEFNEDNRKIDAAFGLSPWVRLKELTTAADAQAVEISFADIDLSRYLSLRVYVESSSNATSFYLLLNNMDAPTGKYQYLFTGNDSWQSTSCMYAEGSFGELFPGGNFVYMGSPTKCTRHTALSWTDIQRLYFIVFGSGNTLKAGTRYTVLGVRK